MPDAMRVVRSQATANVSAGLYRLTELLAQNGYEASHGLLGGEWGYGCEASNSVFEMHPYWWGDCQCGQDIAEYAWEVKNPHAADCYQSELQRREGALAEDERDACAPDLATEWGLSEFGCAVHCTCGRAELWEQWLAAHPHDPTCPEIRPNFRHHASGLEVRWYKYIGRGMEFSFVPDARQWADILDECVKAASDA